MVNQHYRWDFIGLSTDTKPTPATSEKVTDGSTFYTSDDSKLYVWYKDQWYEKEDTGGGGGGGDTPAKTLSSADYDWPEDNPDGVALWKLSGGFYNVPVGVSVYIASNYSSSTPSTDNWAYFITKDNNRAKIIDGNTNVNEQYVVNTSTGSEVTISPSNASNKSIIVGRMVEDNLTSTRSKAPLSAYQGKVLNDKIGDLTTLQTTAKTNVVSAINEVASGSGGEGIKTLTEADYNYPADNPTSVALWLMPTGIYKVSNPTTDQVKISATIDNYGASNPQSDLFIVIQGVSRDCSIIGYASSGNGQGRCWTVTKANGYHTAIMNLNLATTTGTSAVQAMTQKAVTDALNALDARITALGG